jgi:hypothetical protein
MTDTRDQMSDAGTPNAQRRARTPTRRKQAGTDGDFPERDELEPDNTTGTDASHAVDHARCCIDEMPNVEELDEQRWTAELSPDDLDND